MPKYSSASTSTASSSRPRWTPSWTFDFPSYSDPCRNQATWRASRIPSGSTIQKTHAQRQYRLRPDELANLSCVTARHTIYGKPFRGKTFLYNEREVERLAWRKYGSPEHFERLSTSDITLTPLDMISLRESFTNYSGTGRFPYPEGYRYALVSNPQFVAQDVQPRSHAGFYYDSLSPIEQYVFETTGYV